MVKPASASRSLTGRLKRGPFHSEPPTGIDPVTSFLPRTRSTTELGGQRVRTLPAFFGTVKSRCTFVADDTKSAKRGTSGCQLRRHSVTHITDDPWVGNLRGARGCPGRNLQRPRMPFGGHPRPGFPGHEQAHQSHRSPPGRPLPGTNRRPRHRVGTPPRNRCRRSIVARWILGCNGKHRGGQPVTCTVPRCIARVAATGGEAEVMQDSGEHPHPGCPPSRCGSRHRASGRMDLPAPAWLCSARDPSAFHRQPQELRPGTPPAASSTCQRRSGSR